MRREPDFFEDEEALRLLYIAKKLKEALDVEEKLTKAEVDYLVEPDTYKGGIIFASERTGAFFYVAPEHLAVAQSVLREHRYRPYETE